MPPDAMAPGGANPPGAIDAATNDATTLHHRSSQFESTPVKQPRYVQVLPGAVEHLCETFKLSLDSRAVFFDLLLRADWRTGEVAGITVTAYAEYLGISRK